MKTLLRLFIVIITITLFSSSLKAHDAHYGHHDAPVWTIKGKPVHGFFYYFKDGKVYLEDEHQKLHSYAMADFAAADQKNIQQRIDKIAEINKQETVTTTAVPSVSVSETPKNNRLWFWIAGIGAIMLGLFSWIKLRNRNAMPITIAVGILLFYSFVSSPNRRMGNDPVWMDSAFAPFRPAVNTRWDNNWFYVESKGIPAHNMMVGITSWQQQVPIYQCYIGTNAWSIPMNPVKATTPVPVNNQHFLRGAVAIAANGVPIFNPYTNTGVDAFLDGQLDQWGGHSGRADDYHYHIAPMFLEAKSGKITPIAFALDGYGIYANKEPDGTAMAALDANHGHTWKDGRYHYHGSAAAPYMIGNMVGKVTEDTTLQIVPQPVAKGVRPALTPLKGATITGFHSNGNNGYTLIYTLSGATDSIVYSWNTAGKFIYDFYTPAGKTTSNYTGKPTCEVPVQTKRIAKGGSFAMYPNPVERYLFVYRNVVSAEILSLKIVNLSGKEIYHTAKAVNSIDLGAQPGGIYFVEIETNRGRETYKIVKK